MRRPSFMRRGSISIRLAVVFALLMASVVAFGTVLVYVDVRSALDESIHSRLKLRWEEIRERAGDRHGTGAQLARALVTRTDGSAQAFDTSGHLLASTPSVADHRLVDADQVRAAVAHPRSITQRNARPHHRYVVYGGVPFEGAPVVLVAADLRDRDEALEDLVHELALGSIIVIVLSTAIAYAISRSALAPVEHLRRQAAVLASSGASRTLEVPPSHDEIARLATTLNELLDQLYATVERERRFVADAGHELRTPLAIAQGELELLLDRADHSDADRASLHSALDELQYLATLGARLLDMGGISSATLEIAATFPSSVIERTLQRRARHASADAVEIEVDTSQEAVIAADAPLLGAALMNLIDNALRYGRAPVTIRTRVKDDALQIIVRDSGDGFPTEFAARAFEPFTRADAARTSRGTGVGLAIVRDIVQAHDGTVHVDPDDPSAVVLTFPLAPQ